MGAQVAEVQDVKFVGSGGNGVARGVEGSADLTRREREGRLAEGQPPDESVETAGSSVAVVIGNVCELVTEGLCYYVAGGVGFAIESDGLVGWGMFGFFQKEFLGGTRA